MARDKYYEARMQGAVWAGNKIKTEGMEAFDRDMRKRNLLKFAITVTEKEMDETYRDMNALIYHTLITGVLWTLHDMYTFGKKRLKELGIVNLAAPEEFENVNQRYEFLNNSKQTLEEKLKAL